MIKSIRVTLSLDKETQKKLKLLSSIRRQTMSQIIRDLVDMEYDMATPHGKERTK